MKTWAYVVLVRDSSAVRVYLNGNVTPELSASIGRKALTPETQLFLGGRADPSDSFEGRLDELAIYNRALNPVEISDHYRLSEMAGRQ